MRKKLSEISVGRFLLSDGAWGTMLQQKGLPPGECPEMWNVTNREKVLEVAMEYIKAGSDMIETNSFGGSRFKLEKYGLEDRVVELNRTAAEISRQAAGEERMVLGSMGPTGKMLIMEEVTPEELYQAFGEQARALASGGADAIVVETMTDLEEALLAVRAARDHTGLEVICTMTFERLVNGDYRTFMGISPSEMVAPLLEAGVSVIGTNCGNGIREMIPVVKEIRSAHPGIPILVHANAGMPVLHDGITLFPESPEDMAARIPDLVKAGATLIGGCCGTTPQHIRRMKEALDKLSL